uniref:Rhodanese domain-containing protein n=1 Tax=Syphacia muris TaxID=451379 RepID=A0A0N5AUC0_9BILA
MRNYCCSHKLSAGEVFRYSRQILLEEIGPEGQEKLKQSSVLVIGAGPLGLPLITYCAAAGIGRLGVIDDSTVGQVDLIQTFYDKDCFGLNRIDCAEIIVKRNDVATVCETLGKTLVSGALTNSGGTVYLIFPSENNSVLCENCSSTISVEERDFQDMSEMTFGAAFGFISCLMSTEIIKQITSVGFQRNCELESCSQCKRRKSVCKFRLDNVFPANQAQLEQSSLLVVGAGGLGSPVSLYCAAAGINRIGLVDGDKVTVDNLHRQIAYSECVVAQSKVEALRERILKINPKCSVELWDVFMNESNAKDIIEQYDLVADCSDNWTTRSLISDTCGTLDTKKMVVSGSALCWDGQLTVYNNKEKCVCFRCLNPDPLPSALQKTCRETGVICSVVGAIGCLQAAEILRILSDNLPSYVSKLLVYDGLNSSLRVMTLKPNKKTCLVCSGNWMNNKSFMNYTSLDAKPCLMKSDRITARELDLVLKSSDNQPYLIDTRPPHQFRIGHLGTAINIPQSQLQLIDSSQVLAILKTTVEEVLKRGVSIISHRGNQSQLAVLKLREKFCFLPPSVFKDVIGGYVSWQNDVDSLFPIY